VSGEKEPILKTSTEIYPQTGRQLCFHGGNICV
jgi:hypothetical protein